MSRYFDLQRRRFLKGGAATGALVLGTWLAPAATGLSRAMAENKETPASEANLFVALQSDGTVQVTCHRSEMGQHTRTAIAQIIADEMEASWDQVQLRQATGDKVYGNQNTDGSKSIRLNLERLRLVGATVRRMLEQAAAEQWQVPLAECRAEDHRVAHPDGRSLAYGELARRLAAITPPPADQVRLKSRADWRYIGTGMAAVDMDDILTGRATYAADLRLPDTVVAAIARPPVVLAQAESFDAAAAKAVPGVLAVLTLPGPATNPVAFRPLGGVAVLAENTWAAMRGRDQLAVKWSESPNDGYDSDAFRDELAAQNRKSGEVRRKIGDVDRGLVEAERTLSAEYYIPHLAQAPMEPASATARYQDGKVEVWSCTQSPQADRALVADLLGIDQEDVTINVTLLGGGFGRKAKPDFAAEAAWLSRASGRTVRVQWSREDDIRHGFYHAVSAQRLEGGLDHTGRLLALRHRSTFPAISATFTAGARRPGGEVSHGLVNLPLDIPHLQMETGEVDAYLRIGWMRSVGNIQHCFANQSFLAELAHAAGRDHREFLLEAIGEDRVVDFAAEGTRYGNHGADYSEYPYDTGRLKHVLRRATDMARWGREMKPRHGLGLAVHRSFLTYVATVVEVVVSEQGELSIPGVWIAIDAGTVVNTDSVVNQMQGASIYGLSYALKSAITVQGGAVRESNFHDYQVARINESPLNIEVEVVASEAPPAGVGEPGTPPFAPALCNAIFAATGQRIRELPIADQLKM